ncbi:hypothetical protein [Streptomyces sp. NPDC002540]
MRASPPGSAHATDEEALARIDPLWRSRAGAHGGHVAAALTARVVQDAPAEHASVSAATTPPQETL